MNKGNIYIAFFILSFLIFKNSNAQWSSQISGTSQNLRSIQFVNNQTGFCAGDVGTFIKTTNGGNNWNQQSVGTSQNLNALFFFDANTGVVCGNAGVIFRTSNGGNSWDLVPSGVGVNLYGISFSNQFNGICTGNSGSLLYSTNGGLIWSISVTGYLTSYFSCFMVNTSAGFAGGVNTIFQPLVAKTDNGGMNWNYYVFYINSNEGNLRDIHFLDQTVGYAVSNIWTGQGGISHTTNGGVNWTSQIFQYGLNTIDFVTSTTGYCAGYSGFILKTTDAGVSWAFQSSNVSNTLRSVDFTDVNIGYISGDGGIILKTTNGGITSITQNNSYQLYDNLYQNYPNPFNPVTIIKFDIAKPGNIKLYMTDILGREIKIFRSGYIIAGSYEETIRALSIASGTYLIILETDSQRFIRKLLILK